MPNIVLEDEINKTEPQSPQEEPQKSPEKKDKKEGNFLWRALNKRIPRILPFIHPILFFATLVALDHGFRFVFNFVSTISDGYMQQLRPLTLGWALLLTGLALLLPGIVRRIYMIVVTAVVAVLCAVHGVLINMFGKFFSFSDMAFAGDGAAFADTSYIMISKTLVAMLVAGVLLSVLAALLVAPKAKPILFGALPAILLGLTVILTVRYTVLAANDGLVWDQADDPAFLYEDFSDSRNCLAMLGIYQYTFRDLTNVLDVGYGISGDERQELEEWIAARGHESNEMSGIYEGKNLMLVQLESIDTWMLTEKYMPNLWALMQESIRFTNHHTPAYISGGTFNTEFMVNTGILPAASGTPNSVYTKNDFSNSLPALFAEAGYKVQSFHGSEAKVYNRGNVHLNLGYERYWSGNDMGMHDYQLDRFLMAGYDEMTKGEPFYSFVITFSGHGPYSDTNWIGLQHLEKAREIAERTDGHYVNAISHALETDLFIGELIARLTEDGLLDDTVLIFYADHCNYYMLDDALLMDIKGVDTLNKLTNTDLFIYDGGAHKGEVNKVTASIDILPTVANLFGLDCDYASILGHDAYTADGGYVFFQDNSWYDGSVWSNELRQEIVSARRMGQFILKSDWYSKK